MSKLFSLVEIKMPSGFNAFKFAFLLIIIAPIFSSFLFLYSLVISLYKNYKGFIKDNWNKTFIFSSFLMILSLIKNSISNHEVTNFMINSDYWLDLFNWIPFFFIFYFFQDYLSNSDKRKEVSLYFFVGSIPLLIIGLMQAWFDLPGIYINFWGSFNFVEYPGDFITGVFNNPNIYGLWLGLMIPFSFLFFKSYKPNFYIQFIFILIISLIVISILFTYSRLGFISLLIGSLVFIHKKRFAIFTIIFSMTIILINFLKLFSEKLVDVFILGIYPLNLIRKFSFNFEGVISSPRIKIWIESIDYILQRPLLGWGPTSFTKLYESDNSQWVGHAHNLPIQLALNYGILCSAIIAFTIFIIMQKSFIKIFNTKNNNKDFYIDKSWYLATSIVFINHLFDIQYYDGRISIICWVLLAGLKNILEENKNITSKSSLDI